MTTLNVKCPQCGASLELDVNRSAKSAQCTACKTRFDLNADVARNLPGEDSRQPGKTGLLKDPLHTELTPYEVLKVDRGVAKPAVESAFMAALARRVPPNKAKAARDALLNPVKRARCDMLLYSEEALSQLQPNPLQDKEALTPVKRLATAKAWERQIIAGFPDLGKAHCLGILWYWWVLYEETRCEAMLDALGEDKVPKTGTKTDILQALRKKEGVACKPGKDDCGKTDCAWRDDCQTAAPTLIGMWEKVIAYWSMLEATREGWNGRIGLADEEAKQVRKEILSNMQNRLNDRSQWYGRQLGGDHPMATGYRELLVAFSSENKIARAMAASGYRTKRGRICAGGLMLQHLHLLDRVRSQVDGLVKQHRSNADLRNLQNMLSPFFPLQVLLDNNKPDEALERIAHLPEAEQQDKQVLEIKSQALLLRGRQQYSVKRLDAALESWADALECGASKQTREQIEKEVVSSCHKEAKDCTHRDRDRAIDVLEMGLVMVKDQKLEMVLADALAQRAIDVFNKGQRELGNKPSAATRQRIVKGFKKARTELERAVKLGSKRAIENLKIADRILQATTGGLHDLPVAITKLAEAAHAAAQQDNWDTAVAKLEEATRKTEDKRVHLLLGEMLTARAVKVFNRGQEKLRHRLSPDARRKLVVELESAKTDLERAREMGVKRAADNLKTAERVLSALQGETSDLQDVLKMAGRKDWDAAVDELRQIMRKDGARASVQLKKSLATCLANRAVDRANRAGRMLTSGRGAHQQDMARRLEKLKQYDGDGCALCGCSFASGLDRFSVIKLADGTRAPLCSDCLDTLKEMQSQVAAPRREVVSLLEMAKADLEEAAQLDPQSEHVRRNLADAENLLSRIDGQEDSPKPTRSASRKGGFKKWIGRLWGG